VNRILVPLDGSRLSEAILPLAEALARDYDAQLLLLRALRSQALTEAEIAAQEDGERYLAAMSDTLRARGVPGVEWKVWYDEPARAIADAASYSGVDLVTMSTHGRGGLSRLLFGSVAESLVRMAPVPVLLVRGELTWTRGEIGRILVPLDGSELSEAVLPVVERLAGPFDFAVDLLCVVEPIPGAAAVALPVQARELLNLRTAEAEQYLGKIAAALEAKGLRVRTEVREGSAVDAIHRAAREARAGLIAMSTHGRSGLGRLLLGSVAESVLRGAEVPILLWRASAGR
jgi:nucleotide-binding universal stress UspA family protein